MPEESNLSETQKAILNCILSRHQNGFVRQRRLELLSDKKHFFIVPFVVQLISEYIKNILVAADQLINENTVNDYLEFINENPAYWRRTQSRIISYWNEYYRFPECKKLNEYIGKQIIDRLMRERQRLC